MKTVSIYLHIWKILKMVDIAVSFMIFYCYISSKSTIKKLKWVPHKFNWVHESKQSYEYKKYSSLMKQQREDGGAPANPLSSPRPYLLVPWPHLNDFPCPPARDYP